MKREDSVNNLVDAMVIKIQCTKCEDILEDGRTFLDQMDFANSLYRDGWRGTENNIYCPVCAKTFKLK